MTCTFFFKYAKSKTVTRSVNNQTKLTCEFPPIWSKHFWIDSHFVILDPTLVEQAPESAAAGNGYLHQTVGDMSALRPAATWRREACTQHQHIAANILRCCQTSVHSRASVVFVWSFECHLDFSQLHIPHTILAIKYNSDYVSNVLPGRCQAQSTR